MTRRKFLTLLGLAGFGGSAYILGAKNNLAVNINRRLKMSKNPARMPVLFLGHGSPMNAIEKNDFTKAMSLLSNKFEKPKAILCVSAHWLTEVPVVTSMTQPKTIHDFYGFPDELFKIQYPAPGKPELAEKISSLVKEPSVYLDEKNWGLDHGTWSVLLHLFPGAEIPVLQLSIAIKNPGAFHYNLGQQLRWLRDQGVLIIGSGNIVHNLRQIRWEEDAKPFDWAQEFDQWTKQKLLSRDYKALNEKFFETTAGKLSVPTPDHYYPLLYTLGASDEKDEISFEYEGIQNGSISMRCVGFGIKQS